MIAARHIIFATALYAASARSQIVERSTLRIAVTDLSHAGVAASVQLDGPAGTSLRTSTSGEGTVVLHHLVFGQYRLTVSASGFAPRTQVITLRTTVPASTSVSLSPAPIGQTVSVSAPQDDSASVVTLAPEMIQSKMTAPPGHELLDVVADQPGWIFEANGVLHPRESEYETQFIVNGVPHTENLSPSFQNTLPAINVESAVVRTAGYPAEYGRSLGGVIDVTTGANRQGLHGDVAVDAGSFGSAALNAKLSYGRSHNSAVAAVSAYGTDRFLDAPDLENFTNHGHASTVTLSDNVTVSEKTDWQFDYSHARQETDIPNDRVQEEFGQRQWRDAKQDSGSASVHRMISPKLMISAAGSVVRSESRLASNPQSSPAIVDADRGFTQGWTRVVAAFHAEHHEVSAGADAIVRKVRERLAYTITDPSQFEPGTPGSFRFADSKWDVEPAFFVQDAMHLHGWEVSLGIRFDSYRFVVNRKAWSPRVSVSRMFERSHTRLHASYDRIFQYPALENMLLASSAQVDSVSTFVRRIPVEPARANFYELGFAQKIGVLQVAGNVFYRGVRNFADDDLLFNTGVSFPVSTKSARIHGEELNVSLIGLRRWMFQVAYSNQNGTARGPLNGGLFLGNEGADALQDRGSFPISQDQRNTLRVSGGWRCSRFYAGGHFQYNSGLPVESEDDDDSDRDSLVARYGEAVVNRVDFSRGRVKPWNAVDAFAGVRLAARERLETSLEIYGMNLRNSVNVINFAGLLSGTAVAAPRSFFVRARVRF